jgi:cold shock protein
MLGQVKWFSTEKGYGFVAATESDVEYFVHHSNLEDCMIGKDDLVEFEVGKNNRGECATHVRKVEA